MRGSNGSTVPIMASNRFGYLRPNPIPSSPPVRAPGHRSFLMSTIEDTRQVLPLVAAPEQGEHHPSGRSNPAEGLPGGQQGPPDRLCPQGRPEAHLGLPLSRQRLPVLGSVVYAGHPQPDRTPAPVRSPAEALSNGNHRALPLPPSYEPARWHQQHD